MDSDREVGLKNDLDGMADAYFNDTKDSGRSVPRRYGGKPT